MKNIKNLDNFKTPKFRAEFSDSIYSDKTSISYLKISILEDNFKIIDEVLFEDIEALETYKILISNDEEKIKEIFEDIFLNYIEGI